MMRANLDSQEMHMPKKQFLKRKSTKPYSMIVVHAKVGACAGRPDLKERVRRVCNRLARKGSAHWLNEDTLVVSMPGTDVVFAEWAAHQIEEKATKALVGRGSVRASSVQATPRDSFREVLERGVYSTASCPRAA